MKHLLNNLSEEEKNSIREQHTEKIKIDTSKFTKLMESKLGDVKPLIQEQSSITTNVMSPESWYKMFPCLNTKKNPELKKVNGQWVFKNKVLLAATGKGEPQYDYVFLDEPKGTPVGKAKGGGIYYCPSKFPGMLQVVG